MEVVLTVLEVEEQVGFVHLLELLRVEVEVRNPIYHYHLRLIIQ